MEYETSPLAPEELGEWIRGGFGVLAALNQQQTPTTLPAAKRPPVMRRWGLQVARIIVYGISAEVDLPGLRQELSLLMEQGCPCLDVVELTIWSTYGGPASADDVLRPIGLRTTDLHEVRASSLWVAEIVRILRMHSLLFPGPLPEDVSAEQFRQVEVLPEVLPVLVELFDRHPLLNSSSEQWALFKISHPHFYFFCYKVSDWDTRQ